MVWALWLVPFALALCIPFLRRGRSLEIVILGGLGAVAGVALWSAIAGASGGWSFGPRLDLSFELTGFARAMAVTVPAIAIPIVAYALATEHDGRGRLVALLTAFVGAMELLVVAADFLTLLIAWELVGALSWALIGHAWRDSDAVGKAAHAFTTTRFGDLGLYAAAGLAFAATGTLSFDALAGLPADDLGPIALGVLLAAAAKSAQLPFSPWLFSAMAGPTPVSALLHSATMVAAGAYILIRLGPSFESVTWFAPAVATIGITTALTGGIVASTQVRAKRLLAGSTSAQYGLMFVAVGAMSTAAASAHLVAHAAAKALLFLGAGIAIRAAGTADISKMRRTSTAIATLSGIGALALAAVPPLGAAWTKDQVAAAALHASMPLGALVVVAGAFSAFYVGRYQVLAFGRGTQGKPVGPEVSALAVLAAISVALGVLWLPGSAGIVERITGAQLFGGGVWELAIALMAIAVASALLYALNVRAALVGLALSPRVVEFTSGWFGLPTAARVVIADPVLGIARWLARVDDRIIDAGVRGAAWLAAAFARLLAWRSEVTVDGIVRGVAGATLFAARGSRITDERGVDGAVEGLAQTVGQTGRGSRKLQTGLAHHYYVVVAAGLVIVLGVLAFVR